MANQVIQLLDGVKLGVGVKRGLAVSAVASALNVDVAWGVAQVGTVQDDASITNKAALGYNQPGKVIEVAAATNAGGAFTANSTQLLWLKNDGTYVITADTTTGDYLDVCPQFGPDPYRAAIISDLQESYLRQKRMAAIPLARVVSGASAVTSVDNTIAPLL